MKMLERLGYNEWLSSRVDGARAASHELARVISVNRESFTVSKGNGEAFAECSGNLLYSVDSPVELPTTGDWVYTDFYDDDTHAIIHGVVPRKTVLQRKRSGKKIECQLVAANIDTAFIVQSLDYNLNLRRLERYLVMVNEGGIAPVILLSKCDLTSQQQLKQIVKDVATIAADTQIIPYSSLTGHNIDTIKKALQPGSTYCLIGSSGVGKTTLLNSIIGAETFATQEVSKKESKGRHTTTRRELIQTESGALLIDTPGMRELGNMSVDMGIDQTFSEVADLSQLCRFADCSHTSEKGCAVLAALEEGELDEKRYKNYLKMRRESAFNEMSYLEKRKKDKDFGKHVKTVIKSKKGM